MPGLPTWAVHATVREPLALVLAFIGHYLNAGADEILLALDRPDPEQVAVLSRIDRVRLTLADDAWWLGHRPGRRPDRNVPRQVHIANRTFRQLRQDWMLFCDADEFLLTDRPFAELLAETDPDQPYRRIAVAERILTRQPLRSIFDGPFRRAVMADPAAFARIYGDGAPTSDDGFIGHRKGKSVTRRGAPLRIGIHWPQPKEGESLARRSEIPRAPEVLDGATLLHFDGLTPFHLLLKSLNWYDASLTEAQGDAERMVFTRKGPRTALIKAVHAASANPAALRSIVDSLTIGPEQIESLRQAGMLLEPGFDPEPTLARVLGPLAPDLDPGSFDLALSRLHAGLIARHGLTWAG